MYLVCSPTIVPVYLRPPFASRMEEKSSLRLRTHSYPVFTACLRSEWYNQGIKGIPESIFDDLTPVALAHWAKGDGSKCGAGFRFATNSFTYLRPCVKLLNVLIIRYRLEGSIHPYRGQPPTHAFISRVAPWHSFVLWFALTFTSQ
jgi:hypothetical protein